jgi:hypothetical protein
MPIHSITWTLVTTIQHRSNNNSVFAVTVTPTHLPVQWVVAVAHSARAKRREREDGSSRLRTAEDKNKWSFTATPHMHSKSGPYAGRQCAYSRLIPYSQRVSTNLLHTFKPDSRAGNRRPCTWSASFLFLTLPFTGRSSAAPGHHARVWHRRVAITGDTQQLME